MVFNAAIGNTDDHLKNFLMIRDDRGYHLSPAFDLVPNIGQNGEHVMAMGHQFATPGGDDLVEVGRQWFGDGTRAKHIIGEVVEAVGAFRVVAEELQVAPDSIDRFATDIDRRLGVLRQRLFSIPPAGP